MLLRALLIVEDGSAVDKSEEPGKSAERERLLTNTKPLRLRRLSRELLESPDDAADVDW